MDIGFDGMHARAVPWDNFQRLAKKEWILYLEPSINKCLKSRDTPTLERTKWGLKDYSISYDGYRRNLAAALETARRRMHE